MKKTTLCLIALFAALQFSYAQWTLSGTNIYNNNSGNVGIGTTNPIQKLHVSGRVQADYLGLTGNLGIGSTNDARIYMHNTTSITGQNWNLISDIDGSFLLGTYGSNPFQTIKANGNVGIGTTTPTAKLDVKGSIVYGNVNSNGRLSDEAGYASIVGGVGAGIKFYTNDGISQPLTLSSTGNVGIGIIDTKGYKLAVNGSIIATSMKVKPSGVWPDFVFLKDYKLPTLTAVKSYIDKNQHLPDMPSANEVRVNGLDLGEMNRLLLKKVEELTLYLIEKDQQLKNQQQVNQSQQEQIDIIKKQLSSAPKTKNN